MKRKLSPLFLVEAAMAMASCVVLVLALVWEDWIEIVFRIDPDHHSGSVEWLLAVLCVAVTIIFTFLARHQRRKTHPEEARTAPPQLYGGRR
jgi:hypothetical protein